jgi:hypothetical protein
MEDFHVDKRKIQAIYRAVRSFGENAWNEDERRSGRSPDWLKMKNPAHPAVKREEEEDWSR